MRRRLPSFFVRRVADSKRSSSRGPNTRTTRGPDTSDCPGAAPREHDAGLVHTAIRETEEEIGLRLTLDHHFLGPLDETRATARTRSIDMKIAPFVFAAVDAPDDLVLSEEVAATHWIPLFDLFDSAHAASVTMQHLGQTLRFPAIEISGLTIWGLTLRMLRNFETLAASR